MNSLLEHPALAGALKQVTASERAGPCPWCGGEDRFRVWPDHPSRATGGRFLCRGCGRQGDGIQFLREMEGLSYRDASKRLGTEPKAQAGQNRNVRACPVWEPKPSTLPCDAWTSAGGQFVDRCAALSAGGPGLDYALSRGLTAKTCTALRIGWNARDSYEDRTAWGLPPEVNPKTDKPRRVWLPSGLVLPTIRNGQVVAIKIRRAAWTPEDELPKYAAVVGSTKAPMILAPGEGKPVVVVEGELDAILVAQEARDIVAAVALRTAKAKPDAEAHDILKAAPLILVATDADEAGATAFPWWRETYPKAVRWPVPAGKDVGDLAATPGLIRAWVQAGLPDPEPKVEPEPSRPAGPVLLCNETMEGGEPCPYSAADLERFRQTHPHLVPCPKTKPFPWQWLAREWCANRCQTPCGRLR